MELPKGTEKRNRGTPKWTWRKTRGPCLRQRFEASFDSLPVDCFTEFQGILVCLKLDRFVCMQLGIPKPSLAPDHCGAYLGRDPIPFSCWGTRDKRSESKKRVWGICPLPSRIGPCKSQLVATKMLFPKYSGSERPPGDSHEGFLRDKS